MYVPFIIAALLFGCLIPDLPYGYFQFLRIVTLISAGYGALNAIKKESFGWLIPFLLIAILFNPFSGIYLDRENFLIINVVTGIIFICLYKFFQNESRWACVAIVLGSLLFIFAPLLLIVLFIAWYIVRSR